MHFDWLFAIYTFLYQLLIASANGGEVTAESRQRDGSVRSRPNICYDTVIAMAVRSTTRQSFSFQKGWPKAFATACLPFLSVIGRSFPVQVALPALMEEGAMEGVHRVPAFWSRPVAPSYV
jgi:hypothetical protein